MIASLVPLAALVSLLPATPADDLAAPTSPWNTRIELRGTEIFKADLRDGPGSSSVTRVGLDVNIGYAVSPKFRLGIDVDTEGSYYSFKNATGIFPGTGKPFNDVYSSSITPIVSYVIDEEWSIFGGGLLNFAGEPEADIGDSFTGGGFFGARYALSETLSISLQFIAASRLEDDLLFIVAPGVQWQITPTVSLATEKLGLRLKAKLNESWTASLYGSYESREYRMDDDSPLPSGIVRDRSVPVGVDFTYSPSKNFGISLRGGAVVYQKFKVDDSSGDRVSEDNTKPAPFVGLAVTFSF